MCVCVCVFGGDHWSLKLFLIFCAFCVSEHTDNTSTNKNITSSFCVCVFGGRGGVGGRTTMSDKERLR